ncbi:hypothetical protein D1007_59199 [Hordeum vulgare]|nr:hypothetical protein D1007_59199 [Hordeum vulgare]
MEFGVYPVDIDSRKTDLTTVYTNDPVMVEDSMNTMERLLVVDAKYKVVSFDLAYTGGHAGHDRKVVVAKLCMRHHILLYHYFLATMPCESFTKFVNSPVYRYAMVHTTNDSNVLMTSGLSSQKLVDINGHYRV